MIWGFVLSLAMFGIGCGLAFSGSLNFEIVEETDETLKTVKTEHEMTDNLKIFSYYDDPIEYIETDINNVVIEYNDSINLDEIKLKSDGAGAVQFFADGYANGILG